MRTSTIPSSYKSNQTSGETSANKMSETPSATISQKDPIQFQQQFQIIESKTKSQNDKIPNSEEGGAHGMSARKEDETQQQQQQQQVRWIEENIKGNQKNSQQGPISNTDRISNFMKAIKFDEAEKNRSQQKHQPVECNHNIKRHLDELILANNQKLHQLQNLLRQVDPSNTSIVKLQEQEKLLFRTHTPLEKVYEQDEENLVGEFEDEEVDDEDTNFGDIFIDKSRQTGFNSNYISQSAWQDSKYVKQQTTSTGTFSHFMSKQTLFQSKSHTSNYNHDSYWMAEDSQRFPSEMQEKAKIRLLNIKRLVDDKLLKQEEELFECESLMFMERRTRNYLIEYQKKLQNMQVIKETIEKTSESMHGELNSVSIETKVIHFKKERIKDQITGKDKQYFDVLSGKEIVQLENEKDLLEVIKQFEVDQQKQNQMKATLKQQERQIATLEKQHKLKHRMQNQQNSNGDLSDKINQLISINEFFQKIDKESSSRQQSRVDTEEINDSHGEDEFLEDSREDDEMEEDEDSPFTLQGNRDKRGTIQLKQKYSSSELSSKINSLQSERLVDPMNQLDSQKKEKLQNNLQTARPSMVQIREKSSSVFSRRKSKAPTQINKRRNSGTMDCSKQSQSGTPRNKNAKIIRFLESIKENISGFFDSLVERHKALQICIDDLQIRQTMLREMKNDRLKEFNELNAVPIDKSEVQLFSKEKRREINTAEVDSAKAKLRCEFVDETQLEDVQVYKQQMIDHQKMNVNEIYMFEKTQEFYSLNKVQAIILFTSQNLKNIHYRMVRALSSLSDHSYLPVSPPINELVLRANTALNNLNERSKVIFERDPDRLKGEINGSQFITNLLDEYQVKQVVDIFIQDHNIFRAISQMLKYFIPFASTSIDQFVKEFKFGFHLLRFCKKSDLVEFALRTIQGIMVSSKPQENGGTILNQKLQLPLSSASIQLEEKEKTIFFHLMDQFSLLVERSVTSIFSIIMDRIMMIITITKNLAQLMNTLSHPITGEPLLQSLKKAIPSEYSKDKTQEVRYLDFNFGSSGKKRVYSPFLPLSKYSKSQIQKHNQHKGITKYESKESLLTINQRDLIIKKNPLFMNISEIVKEQMCMLHYQHSPSIINLVEEYNNFDDLRKSVKHELKSIEKAAKKKRDRERRLLEEKKKANGKKSKKTMQQANQIQLSDSIPIEETETQSNDSILGGGTHPQVLRENANHVPQQNHNTIPKTLIASGEVTFKPEENDNEYAQQQQGHLNNASGQLTANSTQLVVHEQEIKKETTLPIQRANTRFKMIVNITKAFKMWNNRESDERDATVFEEGVNDLIEEPAQAAHPTSKAEKIDVKQKMHLREKDTEKQEFIGELKRIVHYQMDYKNAKKKGIDQHSSELNSLRNANKMLDLSNRGMIASANGVRSPQDESQFEKYQQYNNISPPSTAPVFLNHGITSGLSSKGGQGEKMKIKKGFVGYFRRKQYEQQKDLEVKLGSYFKHSDRVYQQKKFDSSDFIDGDAKFIEVKIDSPVTGLQGGGGGGGDLLHEVQRNSTGNLNSNQIAWQQKIQINGVPLKNSNSDEDFPNGQYRNRSASPHNQIYNKIRLSIFDKNEGDPTNRSPKLLGEVKAIQYKFEKKQKQSKSPQKISPNHPTIPSKTTITSRSPSPNSMKVSHKPEEKQQFFPLLTPPSSAQPQVNRSSKKTLNQLKMSQDNSFRQDDLPI